MTILLRLCYLPWPGRVPCPGRAAGGVTSRIRASRTSAARRPHGRPPGRRRHGPRGDRAPARAPAGRPGPGGRPTSAGGPGRAGGGRRAPRRAARGRAPAPAARSRPGTRTAGAASAPDPRGGAGTVAEVPRFGQVLYYIVKPVLARAGRHNGGRGHIVHIGRRSDLWRRVQISPERGTSA